jgi:hypothetical protein
MEIKTVVTVLEDAGVLASKQIVNIRLNNFIFSLFLTILIAQGTPATLECILINSKRKMVGIFMVFSHYTH